MKELLELIARALVDQPDQVDVREVEDDDKTLLELRVASDDLGKVIGRQGRTAKSIRTVLSSAGAKLQRKIVFEIVE